MVKGQIISGSFGKVLMREKAGENIQIGELLVAEQPTGKTILQVYDLLFGSQISQQNLELVSGMLMEEGSDLLFMDEKQRNYHLALLKNLVHVSPNGASLVKSMPPFFGNVREVKEEDLRFLTKPANSLFLGNLRSGGKELDVQVHLDGDKVLSHHVLVSATTGRGKSNLTSCILWDNVGKGYSGMLVLDPHDEYFGRTKLGLKDHPSKEKVAYYSPNPPAGGKSLKINVAGLRPDHFDGVLQWSDAQSEALRAYYREYGTSWVSAVLLEKPLKGAFHEGTLGVVKRRLMYLLNLDIDEDAVLGRGTFDTVSGETTVSDICSELEQGKTVIVDTSHFSGAVEILIGSLICNRLFDLYRRYKTLGQLQSKPVVSVVLEEAPRVLGKEVLEKGSNIFSTIAREGRKFKVGLFAITQLPSLIPRQILANMNTKIILGTEMKPERTALIESASQDLSEDDRAIASLDVGEAIVSSNFSKFAIPIKTPFFSTFAAPAKETIKKEFIGIRM